MAKQIKVGHFGNFCPNQNGMFFTIKDLIIGERKCGIDAQFVDWGTQRQFNQQFSRVGLEYEGIKTLPIEWAIREADILVLHSAIPVEVKKTNKPIIMAMHGRPEYSFELERRKQGSCIETYHQYAKDKNVKAFVCFWKEHINQWKTILPEAKNIEYVPASVDLEKYNPSGKVYEFIDKPSIIVADVWREDQTPFNVVFAAVEFLKKLKKGKLHVFGLSTPNETTAYASIFNPLKAQGIVGETHGLITYMDTVYRGADMLVTPHVIATRVVREALASGLPIVAGLGNQYTEFVANPMDIEGFKKEIERCYDYICGVRESVKKECRMIAEKNFNNKLAGEAMVKVLENVIKEKSVIEIPVKIESNFTIHNFIPYCNEREGKDIGKAYNRYMDRVPDNDWVCFVDHDAMFTTPDWQKQLYDIINANPDYSCFTVVTNRIGNPGQRFAGVDQNNHDIKYHREIGELAQNQFGTEVKDITNEHLLSGVVILIKKLVWKEVGGFDEVGFLGVDNHFHAKLKIKGKKVGLMKGVYVYHYYRAGENETLKPVEN